MSASEKPGFEKLVENFTNELTEEDREKLAQRTEKWTMELYNQQNCPECNPTIIDKLAFFNGMLELLSWNIAAGAQAGAEDITPEGVAKHLAERVAVYKQ